MEIREPSYQLSIDFSEDIIDYHLIDNHFDVFFANQLAKYESYNKHLYRPNTYLHKWWARRCGTTFRAILKHLVKDRNKKDFYASGGLEGQVIFDPMMGGGTTLHEAIRLGANVIGADIDPIPVLQARAALTDFPLKKLTDVFVQFYDTLNSKIGRYFRVRCPLCDGSTALKFALYGIRKTCGCQQAVFIDNYTLRHNADGSKIHICPETYHIFHNNDIVSRAEGHPDLPLFEKKRKKCSCDEKFAEDATLPYYRRYELIALIGECPEHGIFFRAPSASDRKNIAEADKMRDALPLKPEAFQIDPGPKSTDLIRRGIHHYLDLFTSRQLLYLSSAIDELKKTDMPARLKLAMIVSTSTEFNSLLCGYKGSAKNRPGAIRHTFAHHAYSFPYTALENNPVHPSKSSGTLQNLFYNRLMRGYKWATRPVERAVSETSRGKVPVSGEINLGNEYEFLEDMKKGSRGFMLIHGSSTRINLPDNCIDHVVTDPPYYDSVQYSDLAAFFRVWLRHLMPEEINWTYSMQDSAIHPCENGNGQYQTALSGIFSECRRVLKNNGGRLIFTFHHWNPKGWADLTTALKNAGFVLVNRYVIHAENQSSVHIMNQNALVHDVILVLGKKGERMTKQWKKPGNKIQKHDSAAFCEQCGSLLGFLLNSEMSNDEIQKTWAEMIEKNNRRNLTV